MKAPSSVSKHDEPTHGRGSNSVLAVLVSSQHKHSLTLKSFGVKTSSSRPSRSPLRANKLHSQCISESLAVDAIQITSVHHTMTVRILRLSDLADQQTAEVAVAIEV